jgi:hypothetical protein
MTRLAAALAWTDHFATHSLGAEPITPGECPSTTRLQFFNHVANVLINETMNNGSYAAGVKQVVDLVEQSASESEQPWDDNHRVLLETILLSQAGVIQLIVDNTDPHKVGSHEDAQDLADLMRGPAQGSA